MKHVEQIAANIQAGIRNARERGEDTTELEQELDKAVTKLLAAKECTIIIAGPVGCSRVERL